jgi:hypothetical protein
MNDEFSSLYQLVNEKRMLLGLPLLTNDEVDAACRQVGKVLFEDEALEHWLNHCESNLHSAKKEIASPVDDALIDAVEDLLSALRCAFPKQPTAMKSQERVK